jgi:aminoglycoside phosphotransferase family enzyme/predicted kinase
MLRPEFYPHPVTAPVRLIQTHISFVLLTGPYAYKVKKAVDLGFLDFSTLERRRHFCQEELRLNARGAPGLYVDVVPITLDGGREPVEYAVRMHQFPADELYSERQGRGELDAAAVRGLARIVAAYHASAPTSDQVRTFGSPDKVRATVEQNFRQTERFARPGGPLTREHFDEMREFTRRFFADRDDAFRRRVTGGFIRECHGDLHLGNVCRWNGRVMLFDCIEFSDDFRFVDTAYDVAFAAMDLEARGRPDLAAAFLNEYLERTGDWDAGAVLPLYQCRQAYVRGKVNSLLAEEPEEDDAARALARADAAHYYALAAEYSRRFGAGGTGHLVLMSGLSGSGKSTVARALAARLGSGAIHIRSDAVRKHLAGVALDDRAGADVYSPAMTARTYARLLDLGSALASAGWVVILDAKYDRVTLRGDAIQRARLAGLPLHIVHCAAPPDVLRERVTARAGDVSDATAGLLEEQQRSVEPFTETERPYVIATDARPPDESAIAVLEAMKLDPSRG